MRVRDFPFFLVLCLALLPGAACGTLLQVSGTRIVNSENNQEVILDAVNFGNWMVMEGYLMNSSKQAPAQHDWKEKLTSLLGPADLQTFYDAWLTNHVTQADINQVKSWGFNAVRLPLHYEYFVNRDTPDQWKEQGFLLLDKVISWCSAAGLYVILDLHAAPGGQSDNAISDYDDTLPSLWESVENQDKTVRLWQKLSQRYKDQPWIAGYDLINEPAWDLPGGTLLRSLYQRITEVIRANRDQHILFIEGNWYSNDYTGLTPAWDPQMVYVFHKYWSSAETPSELQWVLDLRTAENRPIWCGEHGENSNDHFTKMVELLHGQGIGMSWWPMKKFASINGLVDSNLPAGYDDLLSYLGGSNPSLSPRNALSTLMQLAESVRLENSRLQSEVIRAIQLQPGNRDTAPFALHQIPGRVYAADHDQGMNGHAYGDTSWENCNLTTGKYTPWNTGWTYRNNGVDIENCSDSLSNGYNVGWFRASEWMRYTVSVATPGTYRTELRVANGSGQPGKLEIQDGDGLEVLATAVIPDTGGYTSYRTVVCGGGFATSGTQAIRIVNAGGSYNIASVNFVWTDSTVPATTSALAPLRTITLKGSNGLYVTYNSESKLASSTADASAANTLFTLVDAGSGRTALRASNNKYLRLSTTDGKLYADGPSIGPSESFQVRSLSGSSSLQGSNGLYVSSEGGSSSGLTCTRPTPSGWEYFEAAIQSVTFVSPAAAPEAPDGLEVRGDDLTATLTWEASSGASHYTVNRSTKPGGPYAQVGTYLAEPEFTDRFVQEGAKYYYVVVAYAGNVFGPPSEEVTLTAPGLPPAWTAQDIGSVGLGGSSHFLDDTFTLQGSGSDIWGNADAFQFAGQSLSGDCVITARIESMSGTDYWEKAGLMVRESNAADAKNVILLTTPEQGGTRLQWRSSQGGTTFDRQLSQSNPPLWLRLVRSGDTFTAWQSSNGMTWTNTSTATVAMNPLVLVGLAVTSHNINRLSTATFDQLTLSALPLGTSSWAAFQNAWFSTQEIALANLSAPEADANADGLPNILAYGMGLSPWIRPQLGSGAHPVTQIQDGFLCITYQRLRGRFDFSADVEVSGDLQTWNSGGRYTVQTEVVPLDEVREQVTVRDTHPVTGAGQRFIRLRGTYFP